MHKQGEFRGKGLPQEALSIEHKTKGWMKMIYLVIEKGGMSAEDAWSHLIFATTSEELANNAREASEAEHKKASLSAQKITEELEDAVREQTCSEEEEDAYDAASVFLQTHDWLRTVVEGAPTETDISGMNIYL